jgi:hypothetical protein
MATPTLTSSAISGGASTSVDFDSALSASVSAALGASNSPRVFACENLSDAGKVFLKAFNLAGGSVSVGTTAPDIIIPCAKNERIEVRYGGGITFDTGLAFIGTLEQPGTAGATSPSGQVLAAVGRV